MGRERRGDGEGRGEGCIERSEEGRKEGRKERRRCSSLDKEERKRRRRKRRRRRRKSSISPNVFLCVGGEVRGKKKKEGRERLKK